MSNLCLRKSISFGLLLTSLCLSSCSAWTWDVPPSPFGNTAPPDFSIPIYIPSPDSTSYSGPNNPRTLHTVEEAQQVLRMVVGSLGNLVNTPPQHGEIFVTVQLEERKRSIAAGLWDLVSGFTLGVIPSYSTGGITISYEIHKNMELVKHYQYQASRRQIRSIATPFFPSDTWTVAGHRMRKYRQHGAMDQFGHAVGTTLHQFLADAQRDGYLDE